MAALLKMFVSWKNSESGICRSGFYMGIVGMKSIQMFDVGLKSNTFCAARGCFCVGLSCMTLYES